MQHKNLNSFLNNIQERKLMMFKKIFLVISILFYFYIVRRVNAEEILEYNYDDFSIVDNITLYNKAKILIMYLITKMICKNL